MTFNHNWLSKIGFYNLMNALEKIEVDHIMYTPNRNLINRLAKKSIFAIGDSVGTVIQVSVHLHCK